MAVWSRGILWGFMLLLADAVDPTVNYPPAVCAVEGSTVSLRCSFTPLRSVGRDGGEAPTEIVRVVWCQNHSICHGSTPSVFDSNSTSRVSRFRYLGDMKRDCSLNITDIQKTDSATYRFRMEANSVKAHFTGQEGVKVKVIEKTRMRINSSSGDRELTRGGSVTLRCTALCTFHQLEVTWFRDGHALPQSGPALQLSPLTAEDSGNYTCALKSISSSLSLSYSLHVDGGHEEQGQKDFTSLAVGVAFGVLLALLTLILLLCIIRRRRAAAEKDQRSAGAQVGQQITSGFQHPDNICSRDLPPAELEGGGYRQESSRAVGDVNYASIQFEHKNRTRPVQEAEAVIYSSVVSRG